MKLIENPRSVLHHYTTWALGTASALLGSWAMLPEAVKLGLQPTAQPVIDGLATAIVILGFIGKFIEQKPEVGA
ncbi:MAG: hypothetical protein V4772_08715 [Pseudomonadota bacterium]